MAEWFKAPVLKTGVRATVPGVQIPLHPPFFFPGVASCSRATLPCDLRYAQVAKSLAPHSTAADQSAM